MSAQLLQHAHTEISRTSIGPESSKLTVPGIVRTDGPTARKQHHVSFQDDAIASSNDREWGTTSKSVHSSAETQTSFGLESEIGSTKATSSGQSRRDISDLDSAMSTGGDSANKPRNRKRNRNRSDKQTSAISSTSNATSADRSASQPKSRDSSVSGKRGRQQAGTGILPDSRTAIAPKSETRSNNPSNASSVRRDRFPRSCDTRQAGLEVSASRETRQLFDPRRDDPVKFATQQRAPVDERTRPGHGSSSPHMSARASNAASSSSQVLALRDTAFGSALMSSPVAQTVSLEQTAPSIRLELDDPKALQTHIVEVKKVYRNISLLETKLQELHRKQADLEREAMGDLAPPDQADRSYWVRLVARHRELAETYSTFLEMTCRPELPRSVQDLAEVYNVPSRLWQTGFHLMLESLRHNLSTHNSTKNGKARENELLDHLTEFIYYAYSFYSTLLESERYNGFRRAWIESLGDLSRYRMAVAGLAISLSLENGGEGIRNKHGDRAAARIDDTDQKYVDDAASDEEEVSDQVDKASIGSAALGDWEWIEKETWRQTAKDWYAKGTADSPFIGRLQHHIGVLSKDNELRALYHLTKSLVTVKPFTNAKESVLALFGPQRQASRAWPNSSEEELFVHLHGILLSRVQLDDFDAVMTRLLAKLASRGSGRGAVALPQSVLMMMAGVNIAAMLQYGADEAVLIELLLQDSGKSLRPKKRTDKGKSTTPTAILVNPSANSDDNFLSDLPRDAEWGDASEDESDAGEDPQVIKLDSKNDTSEAMPDLPLLARHAAQLCFSMFTACMRSCEDSRSVSPYVTTISTFLLSLCQSKRALRLLERYIPWTVWLEHVNTTLTLTERSWPKALGAPYITSRMALPEDWCLRGVVGLSRQVYDRSVWRNATNVMQPVLSNGFENEVEMLDCDDDELNRRVKLAGDETGVSLDTTRSYRLAYVARKLAKAGRGFDLDTKTSKLSLSKFLTSRLLHWRLKEEQIQLEKQIESLTLQPPSSESESTGRSSEMLSKTDSEIDFPMVADLTDSGTLSDEVKTLVQRRCYLRDVLQSLAARVRCTPLEVTSTQAEIKRDPARTPNTSGNTISDQVVQGYTILVIDTNVILTPGRMLQQLVDSRKWTVIIPLAVVTELDGIRRNDNVLGAEATNAISFLEDRIKSQSKWLKVQTSRGNYLTDLSIRSEDIDFGWNDTSSGSDANAVGTNKPALSMHTFVTEDGPRCETKSVAARNVDEVILRILAWHRDHFVDRRLIVSSFDKALNKESAQVTDATYKTVLLTLDRNLRLKAKTRGLFGLDEKGIARLMEMTTAHT